MISETKFIPFWRWIDQMKCCIEPRVHHTRMQQQYCEKVFSKMTILGFIGFKLWTIGQQLAWLHFHSLTDHHGVQTLTPFWYFSFCLGTNMTKHLLAGMLAILANICSIQVLSGTGREGDRWLTHKLFSCHKWSSVSSFILKLIESQKLALRTVFFSSEWA